MKRIAIYDMDRTITARPTFTPFLVHAALTLNPLRLLLFPIVAGAILLYTLRVIDRANLKESIQRLLVGRSVDAKKLAGLVDSFAEKTERKNIRRGAPARIAQDKAEGYRLVLATASYRLYAEAIGKRMGFDDVIATETLVGLDTRIMATIDGENCYGPAKLRMVTAWMKNVGIAREDATIRFYSDHVSDAPVLTWADEAFAVNAHGPLQKLARNMKWNIVDWS
jgi:HAD superfamily phosphoserine phosphatase-like hydrolase